MINGYSCNIYQSNSKQTRKYKVVDHILPEKHWNELVSRATREVNNSVENQMKNYAKLKEIPKLIQTGDAIAVARKSLPFKAEKTMLNTSTEIITTLIGNQSIPTREIQKARHRGLNKIAESAEKINYLYEPVKNISLVLEAN